MGYVYKITNIITKKCYIGETIKDNPFLRWNEHKRKKNNCKQNTETHRIIMAQAKGIKVNQYDMDYNFLNSYISISEAYRKTGVSTSSICNALNSKTNKACGFIWNKVEEV